MNSINLPYRGQAEYAPDLLKKLGVPWQLARMATQQLFLPPMVTDPDEQATMVTVQALQRGLGITANGVLNRETANALYEISGARWASRTWGQLVGDVVAFRKIERGMGTRIGGRIRDGSTEVDLNGFDSPFSRTAAIAAGVAVLFLAFSGARR